MRAMQSIIVIVTGLALVGVLVLAIMPMTFISVGGALIGFFSPNPPIPEIKRGEFPFKLVYEIEGVQYTIEDTLICEYDGIVVKESGGGKQIEWKQWQKSGHDGIVLLSTIPPNGTFVHGEEAVARRIVYYLGSTEYYMGYKTPFEYTFPDAACHDITEGGLIKRQQISAETLMTIYGVKLISWEISPPLKNTFR